MSSPEADYLRHMLDEVRYLQEQSTNLDVSDFLANPTLQRAFVRSLEIIGEATKHVADSFRSRYPEVQWRAMAGMRDRIIHDYLGVDYEIVWDVIRNKIPTLGIQLQSILDAEDGTPLKPGDKYSSR